MEDDRVGDKELLVARGNKRCWKICKWMQYVLEDKEFDRDISGEVDSK